MFYRTIIRTIIFIIINRSSAANKIFFRAKSTSFRWLVLVLIRIFNFLYFDKISFSKSTFVFINFFPRNFISSNFVFFRIFFVQIVKKNGVFLTNTYTNRFIPGKEHKKTRLVKYVSAFTIKSKLIRDFA